MEAAHPLPAPCTPPPPPAAADPVPPRRSRAPGAERTGTARSAARPKGDLAGKTIAIDPGHNGGNAAHASYINQKVDFGKGQRSPRDTAGTATNGGYSEHEFTLDVSQRLAKVLRARGAKVVLTRTDDKGHMLEVPKRARIGNQARADAAVSVHADGSATGHGFHVIEPKSIVAAKDPSADAAEILRSSQRLGGSLRDALDGAGIARSTYTGDTDASGKRSGITHRDDLGGLRLTTVPKVFVELGNMKDPAEARKLQSAAYRQKLAEAMADGFGSYAAQR